MSTSLALIIESLVAFLLLLTIGYCVVLNQRLKRLHADEQSLKATISELITATEIAERAVEGLKRVAHECEQTLGERLHDAEQCCAELDRRIAAGDDVLERRVRPLKPAATLATPAAPDPHAVAAAARSFADRLRERVAALAA